MEITIDQLEEIAAAAEATEQARRQKLCRLIAAYARITSATNPRAFKRRATEYADEDGHYDNSFPPDQVWKNRTGPRTILVEKFDWERIATSSGFYHDYKMVASDPGLYVDRRGTLWGGELSGAGRVGQFAAYPGPCNVDAVIDWSPLDVEEIPLERLEAAEKQLRELAFPLVARRLAERSE